MKSMYQGMDRSLKQVDGEGALSLFRFFLEDEHGFDFQVGVFELVLGSNDVADLVVVDDAPNFGIGVRVVVDRDEAEEVGHHQVTVHHLEQVYHRLWLVLRRAHLHQTAHIEILQQINFQNCREGLVVVPGQYQSSGYL
jgi:hypothetical protein